LGTLSEADMIRQRNAALCVEKYTAIQEHIVTDLKILRKVESYILLCNEVTVTSRKQSLGKYPSERNREVHDDAYWKLVQCIPQEMHVPLWLSVAPFIYHRQALALEPQLTQGCLGKGFL